MPPSPDDVYGLQPSRPEDYHGMHLDVIRQRWDEKARRWDDDLGDEHCHLNEDGAYRRFLDAAETLIALRAEFCRQSLLVDLGCGTGLVLAQFIDRFAEGLGIDLSPEMLAVAARRQLPRARWLAGNCFELARSVTGAGAVLCRGVILSHYGPQWASVLLEQVRRALVAEGGFAFLDFLNAEARLRYACHPANKTYFTADEMTRLGRQAGFGRVTVLGEPERRVRLLLLENPVPRNE